jgi:hypothetical protein
MLIRLCLASCIMLGLAARSSQVLAVDVVVYVPVG